MTSPFAYSSIEKHTGPSAFERGELEQYDWDELIAVAADGDLSQYDIIENKVTLKQIGVFLMYRKRKFDSVEGAHCNVPLQERRDPVKLDER